MFGSEELQREKLNEQIAESIQQLISSRQLHPGDRLPSERELAGRFKVNRATVREAIHLLRERGLVERKNGTGTRVVEIHSRTVGEAIRRYFLFKKCSHSELQDLRLALEPKIASLAATHGNVADLALLGGCLEKLEASWVVKDYPRLGALDANFHLALAIATHNSLIHAVYSGISELLTLFITTEHRRSEGEASFRTHREVYEAVLARDPDRAAQAMLRQMETTPILDEELSLDVQLEGSSQNSCDPLGT